MMHSTTPLELKGGGMVGLHFKIVKIEIGLFVQTKISLITYMYKIKTELL